MTLANGSKDDNEHDEINTTASVDSHDDFADNNERGSKLTTDGSALKGECFAPPGKLGIAIDTINGQSVVHRVREDSPLSGVLRRLDVIIAVDEVDTTSMTSADVTSLMAKRMTGNRKITFLRGKAAQECLKKTSGRIL